MRGRCARPPFLGLLALLAWFGPADAEQVSVAVAANFAETLDALTAAFSADDPAKVVASAGATGQLYAKIQHGAPYDLFLAADSERPRLLAEQGFGVPESRFTYAIGRLVLWSADPTLVDGPEVLLGQSWRHLAIASPELAPYGLAAMQVLRALDFWENLLPRLVRGASIGQTFQFVATGSADLGFVAQALVESPRNRTEGSGWPVPPELHEPIRQDAILLAIAAGNPAAGRFLEFLQGDEAGRIITAHGYGRDP